MSEFAKGASDIEVRAELQITHKLWQSLLLTDPEFEDVVRHGRMLSKAWWMSQGRVNLTNKEFSSLLYKINMQNRFNWSEKTGTVEEDDVEDFSDPDEIDRKLLEAVEAAKKKDKGNVVQISNG